MHHNELVNIDQTDLLLAVTGERSVRAIAIRIGIDPSTLTRQVKAGVKAETVIEVARAFKLSSVATLVRFGFLTEAEALEASADGALANATDEQLAQEILARVRRATATDSLTDPMGVDKLDELNVGGLPEDELPHVGAVDIEALRRSGVALAADERDGLEYEQEQSQEQP